MFEVDTTETEYSCDISTYYFYNFETQNFELDIELKNKLIGKQKSLDRRNKNLFYIGKNKEKIKNLEKIVKIEKEKRIKYMNEIVELKKKLKI